MKQLSRPVCVLCLSLLVLTACGRTPPWEEKARGKDPATMRIESAHHLVVIVNDGVKGHAAGRTHGLRRRYGGQGTAECVDLELDWLARHQNHEEGCWDAAGFQEECCGNLCNGKGHPHCNPGTTALALLYFLGGGHTHQAGKYKKTVNDGLKYLKRIQDEEGCFGPRTGPCLHAHAVCTLAMAEAYGFTSSPLLRHPLEKGLSFLYRTQNEDTFHGRKSAWGESPGSGQESLEVTAWALMALGSARNAGLEIRQEALDGIKKWLDGITVTATGIIGGLPPRGDGCLPASPTEACTAMGMLMRVILGEDPGRSEVLKKGAAYLLSRLPDLQKAGAEVDGTTLYFGTLALFNVGGRTWATWNRALKKWVVDTQRKSGCEKGSWDPVGSWASFGGRIHASTLLGMTLQVYYRYGKALGTRYAGGAPCQEEQDGAPAAPAAGYLTVPGARERFPLEHTEVHAEISGWFAATRMTQTFGNPFRKAMEATYVFPLPTRAAVNDFAMEVRGQRIVGVVRPKKEAERMYNQAVSRGQTASLLTQRRPNVFAQSVGGIPPGEKVKVHLTYFHPVESCEGVVEYRVPMVVGPRYAPPGTREGVSPPILPPGQRCGHDISLRVSIRAGLPVHRLHSPTHSIQVLHHDTQCAVVELHPHDAIPDRDFILRWRVAGAEIRAGLVAHRTDECGGRGYFSAFLVPLLDPSDADVTPREVTFILDTSGSMGGQPLNVSRWMVKRALAGLRPYDRFNIIRFAGSSGSLAPAPLENTGMNVQKALSYLEDLEGGGGTEMLTGIRHYLDQPRDARYVRIVCFLTDGYVGNEREILGTIRSKGEDARWHAFGIGSSVNRFLVEGIAEHGRGVFEVVVGGQRHAAESAAERFLRCVDSPMLVDVTLDGNGLPVTDVYPEKIPDLCAGRALRVTGRYTGPARGTMVFRGRVGARTVSLPLQVVLPEREPGNAVLAPVWARSRIRHLMNSMFGRDSAACKVLEKEITGTAMAYGLASRYTAFVAVDESRIVGDGKPVHVIQPVAAPKGVRCEGTTSR